MLERFYLGTHRPAWLGQMDIPLFVSDHTLSQVKNLPRALGPWALDSGGFTELDMHGKWTSTSQGVRGAGAPVPE